MTGRRGDYRWTFAVLATGIGAFALLQSLVLPVLPTVQEHLGTSQSSVTWVLTAYLLAASIFTPILGRIGDMTGKRRMMLVALGGLIVGSALAALATSMATMIVARVIQGLGGGLLPLAFGIVRDEFPRERINGAMGVLASVIGAGSGLGLVLAGPINDGLGYRWLFWIPLIIAAVTLVAARLLVPESPVRLPGRIGWLAPALLSSALVALLIGVSKAPTWGWGSAKVLGLLALSIPLAVAWVRVELRSEHPLIDMHMMRIPAVWTANLIALMVGAGVYAAYAFVPQFVQTTPDHGYGFGSSVTESGLIMLPMTITQFAIGVFAGALVRRYRAKPLLILGALVSLASFVMLAGLHGHPGEVALGMGLLGFGFGLVFSVMPSVIVGAVPPEQTSVAAGMNANIRTMGGAIGAAAMATVVTATEGADGFPTEAGYTRGFAMLGIAALISALSCLLLPSVAAPRSGRRDPAAVEGTELEYAELALTPAAPLDER